MVNCCATDFEKPYFVKRNPYYKKGATILITPVMHLCYCIDVYPL